MKIHIIVDNKGIREGFVKTNLFNKLEKKLNKKNCILKIHLS